MSDVLEIYDQACAAWLLCSGVKLVRVIPDQWCRYAFMNDSQQASNALERWKTNTGLVRVRDYARAYSLIIKLTKTSRLTAKGVVNGNEFGAA